MRAELRRFRESFLLDESLQEHFHQPGIRRLHEESQFRLLTVQQLVAALEETRESLALRLAFLCGFLTSSEAVQVPAPRRWQVHRV